MKMTALFIQSAITDLSAYYEKGSIPDAKERPMKEADAFPTLLDFAFHKE